MELVESVDDGRGSDEVGDCVGDGTESEGDGGGRSDDGGVGGGGMSDDVGLGLGLGLDGGGGVGVSEGDGEGDGVSGLGKSAGTPLIISETRPRGDCSRIVTLSPALQERKLSRESNKGEWRTHWQVHQSENDESQHQVINIYHLTSSCERQTS